MKIVLNSAHLDYLRLTTFERPYIDVMSSLFPISTGAPARWLQYDGWEHRNDEGSIFFGQAVQRGRDHFMMQASGYRAHPAWEAFGGTVLAGQVRVTRVDVALTVDHGYQTWSQSALFSRLRGRFPGKAISYVESLSGPNGEKLATVYVGSKHSDRKLRVYEKVLSDQTIALRSEVQFGYKRAQAVAQLLLSGKSPAAVLRAELERLRDEELMGLYADFLTDEPSLGKVVKSDTQTERWLFDQVLPALQRFLNEHGHEAHELRYAYLKVLLNTPGAEPVDE